LHGRDVFTDGQTREKSSRAAKRSFYTDSRRMEGPQGAADEESVDKTGKDRRREKSRTGKNVICTKRQREGGKDGGETLYVGGVVLGEKVENKTNAQKRDEGRGRQEEKKANFPFFKQEKKDDGKITKDRDIKEQYSTLQERKKMLVRSGS